MKKRISSKGRFALGLLTVVSLSVLPVSIATADDEGMLEQETVDVFDFVSDGEELTRTEEEFYSEFDDASDSQQAEVEEIVEQSDVVVVTEKQQEEELMWADDSGRSISAINNAFHLTLAEGDRVDVGFEGDTATWYREDGIALVSFDTKVLFEDGDAFFIFDEETGMLKSVAMDVLSVGAGGGHGKFAMAAKKKCANKWVSNGFNILWDDLVCLPATWGTGGLASVPCYVAGTALNLAISC